MSTPAETPPAARKRPRIFYGWYIVGASNLSNAITSAVYFQGFSAFILPIETTFGWSRSVISAAASLRQAESGLVGPAVGFLVDRLGPRRIIVTGAIIVGLGLIGLGFSNGVVMFYTFFLLISIGTSGVGHGVTWPTVVARWFRRKRGLAIGLTVMGPIIGAPMVVANTWLIDAFGWRPILVAYGVVITIVVSLMGLVARDRPEDYGLLPDGDEPAAQATPGVPTSRQPESGMRVSVVARSRAFWLLSAYLGGMFIANSGFQLHQIPYFVNDRGFSSTAAATTIWVVIWASGFGRAGGGWLLDKFDYRIILVAASVILASSFVYLQVGKPDNLVETLPFDVLFGVAFGTTIPMRGALGSMMFGTRSLGAVVGLLQGTGVAAGVIGPILMGVLFDLRGDYSLGLWIIAAIALAGSVPVLFMESGHTLAARVETTRAPHL